MEEFTALHKSQLLWTGVILIILLALRYVINRTTRRIGRSSDLAEARIVLISKYITFILTLIAIVAFTFIWGVDFRELGLLFSSIFAVIGVALFAQWSIISNITAGVILFFSFPFKIGDRVRIMDKEISPDADSLYESFIIEDIKAFHLLLRNDRGNQVTYPNNMLLQKGVILVKALEEET